MKKPILSARNITKVFDLGEIQVRALRGVDLDIFPGEFVAIMGHSGSGKSTFMNIIGCLDIPTSGEVYIDNVKVTSLTKDELADIRNQKIGFVFQAYNLLARTTAIENVELPLLYNNSVNNQQRLDRSINALEKVGLANRLHHLSNQLSGGQQQRVAIARALVNEPVVIMADEPTGNLDTRTSYEVMQLFQALNEAGSTIILVTHEPDIATMAKRNIVFKDGRIIKDIQVDQPVNASNLLANLKEELVED
ncbi:MAG: macrolide ABC transporter ATP-binding protein [Cyclobacteriaceae bacterium]|nr:MAG: macrolide ABC transporter ATP-binding protein [Cyclobacteriaceae bacterium]